MAQLCQTLLDPMDCSLPGSSVHGVLQARILEWVATPFSSGSSGPGDQTQVSLIAGRFFTIWATRGAQILTPSHPSRSSQSTELTSLCDTVAFHHRQSILHIVVYICQGYSSSSSHLLLPSLCPQVPSLCLCLQCCPVNRFIHIIFLDSIYTP